LYEAAREMWTEHPKKYGVSSLLLGLAPREELHENAKTDFQKLAVQAVMDDNLVVASDKATLYRMMEERGLDVYSDVWDEEPDVDEEDSEEEVPFSLVERSSRLDRSLGRKGFVKFFENVGKGIVKVAKAVGGAIVSGFVAIGKAVVTIATAIGNVIKAFVDFVLSLFKCFGFGTVGTQGYTAVWGPPLNTPAGYFKFSLSASVSDAIGGIFQGQVSRSIGVGIALGFTIGVAMDFGVSLGVGISAGIACGVNSRTGGSCVFSIGVGITASASIPSPTCIFGMTILSIFKCGKSYGLTLKIMCCNINLVTGCSSCGKGCSDSSTGSSSSAATNAVNKRGAGAISCSENLSGNGASYRGCQDRTTSGKVCQKWSAQNPHKHTQCRSEYQTMKGKRMKVYCETTTDTNKGLGDHNLCRNPDGHSTIWCYTIHKDKRWENCSPASGIWMNLVGKSASQVSTGWSGPASKAIDGNAANNYPSGSCTHTHAHNGAWWTVNLGSTQTVKAVKVTNRGDCCGSRLNGFNVKVGSRVCASNVQISQGQTKEVACSGTGSSVTIQLRRHDYLTLCEVGVKAAAR